MGKKRRNKMTSFNELALAFRNIIDDLFNSNGFECRKLFYGDEIFYCGRDILKCLNYSENGRDITKILLKINDKDKFTIGELLKLHSSLALKASDDLNKDFGSSQKAEAKPFQDFIYDTLLPALDNKYKELIKS